ncbi:MAG: dienelactone hydrolase family protein [Chloroflexota bacterium]|nr:dienelactone hydrolase family protein [Chloroflexota bacterium]
MWNSFSTDAPQGQSAGVTTLTGANGDQIHAYVARPDGDGPFPGIVAVHHMPGWDEFYQEFVRRLANHGYTVICPDLYCRAGHGPPDDIAAKVRADGGVADDQVVGDLAAAREWLRQQPSSNGKVGIVGTCSGGRQALLTASRAPGFDAVVDLWGGRVVAAKDALTPKQPVAPVDYTKDLQAPLLGLFGNDDQAPSPAEVDTHETELKKHAKAYEFHRYDGAGHGFFYYDRPPYRQQQAMDGWNKVFAFFDKYLKH